MNILTFSVLTENTFRRGSITICLKFSVPSQQKSSTGVISKPCNSFLKCQKNNVGSKQLHLPPSLSNPSLTHKYQFLEASDKPYIQVFNFQTISFSSNSGGGVKYMTVSISFSCKKADVISMELHVHLLDAMIARISLRLSLVQVGESFSICEESSSKPQATNLTLIFFFPLTNFSVSIHLVVIVF